MEEEKTQAVRMKAMSAQSNESAKSPRFTSLLTAFAVILVDHLSKWLAPAFGWQLSYNTGFSFGLASSSPGLLFAALAVAFALAAWWWVKEGDEYPVFLGLVVGGALANLADRLLFGGVRDWLPIPFTHLHNNLADWAIVIGVGTYIMRNKPWT